MAVNSARIIAIARQWLRNRQSLRHVMTLMSGTFLAQVIGLLMLPALARIYSVAEFGEYAVYLATTSLFTLVATGRYEMAIMLPKQHNNGASLVQLSIWITVALAVALWCLLLMPMTMLGLVDVVLPSWLGLLPLAVLLAGYSQSLNYWLSRHQYFRRISNGRVLQALTVAIVSIAVGKSEWIESGLIVGLLMGQVVLAAYYAYVVRQDCPLHLRQLSWRRVVWNGKRYKDFPLINTLHVSVDAIQNSALPWLIKLQFGVEVLGAYSMAVRIVKTPLGLVGGAISQVFFQKSAVLYAQTENIQPLFRQTIRPLLAAGGLIAMLLIFSPMIFEILLGSQWALAGRYVLYLLPWLVASFVISAISQIPVVTKNQRPMLIKALVGNLIVFVAIGYGGVVHSMEVGLLVASLLMLVYFVMLGRWFYHISGKPTSGRTDGELSI